MNIRPLKDYEEIKAQLGDTSPKFKFNPEELEIEKEPLIGDMFEGTDEYVENRVQSYKDFLKSDLCRQIMEIENIPYQGDNA